jgi:microcystin-dependent protein
MLKKSFKTKSISTILSASALVMGMGVSAPVQASDPFLAEIVMFGGNFAPRGWAYCDGQLLAISSNQALFSLLGTTYGGDGRTTFGLPDMRGRTAIGPRTGPGLSSYTLGQRGGAETVTLTQQQMPSHNHTASTTATLHATDATGRTFVPTGAVLASKRRTNIYRDAAPDVDMHADSITATTTVNNNGGSQAHENRMPYLAINHIIALVGTFPSRN